jgi:hypothetical protein
MKLTIFQSDKGDCLLIEAKSGELVLCDGGMGPSMRNHVRAELSALRDQGRALELVYISHIDNDHISGVLQLLEDEVEWRVFDHHQQSGRAIKVPQVPRPPVINGILHNSFRDQIKLDNKSTENLIAAQAIEKLLTGMAPVLLATGVPELVDVADEMQAIATGIPQAIQVSRLIAPKALNIPLNKPPGVKKASRLLYAGRPGQFFNLGSMKFTLIGPTEDELNKLRHGWKNWLSNNQTRIKKIREELKRQVDEFSTGFLTDSPFDLTGWEGIPDYKGVTVPNIASLMWMVDEGEGDARKRLLLTGDAQPDFILSGLERRGFLANGSMHLDVLKVQHHGSPNNLDADFAKIVSADHYVFCGNGEHTNPDIAVIDLIYNSRLSENEETHALAPKAKDREFHFWFSTTSTAQTPNTKKREYFQKVEQKVRELVEHSNGMLHAHFNDSTSIVLDLEIH